jgi:hypothetical protein
MISSQQRLGIVVACGASFWHSAVMRLASAGLFGNRLPDARLPAIEIEPRLRDSQVGQIRLLSSFKHAAGVAATRIMGLVLASRRASSTSITTSVRAMVSAAFLRAVVM